MHDVPVTVKCKKFEYPIRCSRCRKLSGWPNGTRKSVSKGMMQQIRCRNCRRQWSAAVHNNPLFAAFAGKRTRVSFDALLQGFALIVSAVPMCRVELLVRIKAETIKKKLLFFLRKRGWEELQGILKQQFQITSSHLSDFESVIVFGEDMGQCNFLDWSKELRRQGGADRAACARLASRILGRDVKVREIASRN